MNRRDTVFALAAIGVAPFARARQPGKVWRIGMLETTSMAHNAANLGAFREGMQQRGYVEGKNYVLDYRSADGRTERFDAIAKAFVSGKVDLIVTRGTPATLAAKKATATIPVVTTAIGEPLLVVASLARPGGNITGLTAINTELQGKRIELLRQILPRLARIARLGDMSNPAVASAAKELERVARSVGIQTLLIDVRKADDLAPAFEQATKYRAEALSLSQDSVTATNGQLIIELAAKRRLPIMFQSGQDVVIGGLISYGVNYPELYRRAAAYVDKILKGANPGDLPMEQPTKLDLAINLKTAKELGLVIPKELLYRADQVIE